MTAVKELIRIEENGGISFGDYELGQKTKLADFEYAGDIYKVKTFGEITKFEKNDTFVYESVPGTAVLGLVVTESGMTFDVSGPSDASITVELEADSQYQVSLDGNDIGQMNTNLGGKLSFNVELDNDKDVSVAIQKI